MIQSGPARGIARRECQKNNKHLTSNGKHQRLMTSSQSSSGSKPNWAYWALGAAGVVGVGALAYFWLRPTQKNVFRGHHAFGARTSAEKAVEALDNPYFSRKTLMAMYRHLESMTGKTMKIDREEFRLILKEIGALLCDHMCPCVPAFCCARQSLRSRHCSY
jgi:hypothetical protein